MHVEKVYCWALWNSSNSLSTVQVLLSTHQSGEFLLEGLALYAHLRRILSGRLIGSHLKCMAYARHVGFACYELVSYRSELWGRIQDGEVFASTSFITNT